MLLSLKIVVAQMLSPYVSSAVAAVTATAFSFRFQEFARVIGLVAVIAVSCEIFRDDIISCSCHGGAVAYVIGSAVVMAVSLNYCSRKVPYATRNADVTAGPLMFC